MHTTRIARSTGCRSEAPSHPTSNPHPEKACTVGHQTTRRDDDANAFRERASLPDSIKLTHLE